MKKINKKGFTLVELLLVIAIIGILAAVLFVSLGKQRERARMTTFKENMRGLITAATACHDGGGSVLATAAGDVTADGSNPVCVGAGAPEGIGNIPEMTVCTGGPTQIDITVANPDGDNFTLAATCPTSGTNDCVASCNMDGCTFTDCE